MRKSKLIVVIIIILIGGYLTVGYIARELKTLDYFKIKDIVIRGADQVDLSYLKGRNIIVLDLQKESRYLSLNYPVYKKIRLVRILPDHLFVDFIKRKPKAYVKLYRYFCIDEDMALFDVSANLEGKDNLPVILGLDTKIFGPKQGKIYNIEELALALNIIKEAKSNRVLKDYEIKSIDVTDPSCASFFIPDGLEIKIGQDDTKDKIDILGSLLSQVKNDLNNVKYIDLRFKEPVIKFKDVK